MFAAVLCVAVAFHRVLAHQKRRVSAAAAGPYQALAGLLIRSGSAASRSLFYEVCRGPAPPFSSAAPPTCNSA